MPARHNTGPVETRLARSLSASGAASLADPKFATYLDQNDKLADLRAQFSIPTRRTVSSTPSDGAETAEAATGTGDGEQESVYLAGNSLGLMPKRTPELLSQELHVWSTRCVRTNVSYEVLACITSPKTDHCPLQWRTGPHGP